MNAHSTTSPTATQARPPPHDGAWRHAIALSVLVEDNPETPPSIDAY